MMTRAWIFSSMSQINGIEIIGFSENIEEAINKINKVHPDLLIINYHIYRNMGTKLIGMIKRVNSNIKITILGENTPANCEAICLNDGADYYFDKINNNRKNSSALLHVVHEYNKSHERR